MTTIISILSDTSTGVSTSAKDVTLIDVGVPGPQGPSGNNAAKYVHIQVTPSTTWTVNHNLGNKPLVTLLSAGSVEVEAEIVHVSDNQFLVSFNAATGGSAICQ